MKITVSFGTKSDLQLMRNLDFDIYPIEGIVKENTSIHRLNKDPYQYLVAKDGDYILQGYLNIVSVTDQAFKKILEGKWVDSEDLIADNILSLTPNSEINCYITSIVTRNDNREVAAQLLFGLLRYVRLLSKKNIKLNKIAAISFSKDGERLCRKLGFEPIMYMEQLSCGFIPCLYLLDLKKDNSSFLINKIRKILFY